jgi:hypothetical protein
VLLIAKLVTANVGSKTCLLEASNSYGGSLGTAFTDLTYLIQNQNPDYYPRLGSIIVCSDDNGNLKGV